MVKTAQISVFLIVGLILVVAAVGGGIYYLNSNQVKSEREGFITSQADFEAGRAGIITMVQNCLEQQTEEGMRRYSIRSGSGESIAEYLEYTVPNCIDYAYYEERGFTFAQGDPHAEVSITEEAIVAELDYRIIIQDGDDKAELRRFTYTIQRQKAGVLSLDETGATTSTLSLMTEEETAELIVPPGVKATSQDGTPLTEVSIQLLDKNFEGLSNSVLVGKIAYEGLPDGARFDSPVTIKMRYEEEDIPEGMTPYDLQIAYYDSQADVWKSLPTYVDTRNRLLISQTTHFTPFGKVARCGTAQDNRIEITSTIYFSPCQDSTTNCDDNIWEQDNTWEGLYEKQSSASNSVPPPTLYDGGLRAYSQLSDYECTIDDWDQDDKAINPVKIIELPDSPCEDDSGNPITVTNASGNKVDEEKYCIQLWQDKVLEKYGSYPGYMTSFDNVKDSVDKECHKYKKGDLCELDIVNGWGTLVEGSTWESRLATLRTYGYAGPRNDDGYAAGYGTLYFEIKPRGDSCLNGATENPNQVRDPNQVWMEITHSSNSPYFDELVCSGSGTRDESGKIRVSSCADFVPFDPAIAVIESFAFNPSLSNLNLDRGLRQGLNKMVIRVKDPEESVGPNGCMTVRPTLYLNGIGITPQPTDEEPCTADSTTVKQRIDYLCGCKGSCEGEYPSEEDYPNEYIIMSQLYDAGYANTPICDPEVAYRLDGLYTSISGKCDGITKICRIGKLTSADRGCLCQGIIYEGTYSATCQSDGLVETPCNSEILYSKADEGCMCGTAVFKADSTRPDATYYCDPESGRIVPNCPEGILLSGDKGCYCVNAEYEGTPGMACSRKTDGDGGIVGLKKVCQTGKLVPSGDEKDEPCLCGGKTYWEGTDNNVCYAGGNLQAFTCDPTKTYLEAGDNGCLCRKTSGDPVKFEFVLFEFVLDLKQKCTSTGIVGIECPKDQYLTKYDDGCTCGGAVYNYASNSGQATACLDTGDGYSIISATCPGGSLLHAVDNGCTCKDKAGNTEAYVHVPALNKYCGDDGLVSQSGAQFCPEGTSLTGDNAGCLCKGTPFEPAKYCGEGGVSCDPVKGFVGTRCCTKQRTLITEDNGCLCQDATFEYVAGRFMKCTDNGLSEITASIPDCPKQYAMFASQPDCKCTKKDGSSALLSGCTVKKYPVYCNIYQKYDFFVDYGGNTNCEPAG